MGLGPFNVAASWVMACEYLSLGLHVGNHSRLTPLTIIFVPSARRAQGTMLSCVRVRP